jgi:hypothetical protein
VWVLPLPVVWAGVPSIDRETVIITIATKNGATPKITQIHVDGWPAGSGVFSKRSGNLTLAMSVKAIKNENITKYPAILRRIEGNNFVTTSPNPLS